MMRISSNIQTKLLLLTHHIAACAEMLYTDALLLKITDLANYILPVVTEAAEIRRIIVTALHVPPETDIFSAAIKDELSRRCYIISFRLNDIPVQLPPDILAQSGIRNTINSQRKIISSFVEEFTAYCEKVFGISTDGIQDMPIDDLQTVSDTSFSQYLDNMENRVENAMAGTIVMMGERGASTELLHPLFLKAGFHTVLLTRGESLQDAIEQYDVTLVCFDCGNEYDRSFKAYIKLLETPEIRSLPFIVCGDSYSDTLAAPFLQHCAMDYFAPGKSVDLFFARVHASAVWRTNNYHQQLYMRALEIDRHSTAKEFSMAAEYVTGMLPPTVDNDYLTVDWTFMPSIELGGDIFGYGTLSETQSYLYLLDVSGHGLEASLYSVTIMNLLKQRLLNDTDFANPASVLSALNHVFDMESQNNMFFTIWYGVYDREQRVLTYSSAGSQPALLFCPGQAPEKIATGGTIIGADEDSLYENAEHHIPAGSKLYLFSDGIFEIRNKDGNMMTQADFFAELEKHTKTPDETCTRFVRRIESASKDGQFDDDVSLLEVSFK